MKLSDTIYTTEQHKQSKNVFLIIIGTILFSIYAGLLIPVNNIGAGGALGLSIGYALKYFLDKKMVFVNGKI